MQHDQIQSVVQVAAELLLLRQVFQVQLGRRNADFIEVLGGLKPGERVITSSYSGLTDKDRLTFSSGE